MIALCIDRTGNPFFFQLADPFSNEFRVDICVFIQQIFVKHQRSSRNALLVTVR